MRLKRQLQEAGRLKIDVKGDRKQSDGGAERALGTNWETRILIKWTSVYIEETEDYFNLFSKVVDGPDMCFI